MSLQTRLEALIAAIGADVKALRLSNGMWSEQSLASQYTNSTVTGSDVFSGFALASNSRYELDILLAVSSIASTTGIQVALAGPTTGITYAAVRETQWMSTTTADRVHQIGLNTFPTSSVDNTTTPSILTMQALIATGSVGSGNVRVQARSEVAGSAVYVREGSYMRMRKLP